MIEQKSLNNYGTVAALAGISAVISGVCTHPTDTIKVQMQLQHLRGVKKYKNLPHAGYVIIMEEGLTRGIGKGLVPSIMKELSYSTIRLGAFEPIKKLLGEKNKKDTPIWKRFLAGSLAGLVGQTIAQPVDMLKTRAQGQHWQPLKQLARQVWSEGGVSAFYKGLTASQARAFLLGASGMGFYDTSQQYFLQHKYFSEGIQLQFTCSIISGFMMTLTTIPLDNIKSRMMNQVPGQGASYSGIIDCAKQIYRNEGGLISFQRGFGPQWARFAPVTTIQLLTWEWLRKVTGSGQL